MNKSPTLPPIFTSLPFTGSSIAGKYAIVDLGPITVIMVLSMGLILLGLQFTLK